MKFALLVTLFVLSVSSAFAQVGYPLTCVFDGNQSVGIEPSMTQARKLNISFSFKRGARAATEGVLPGTCAWQDRAMYNDEPTIVIATVPDHYNYIEYVWRGTQQLVLAPSMAPWVPHSKTAGYRITFKVYQSGPADGTAVNFFKVVQ